ncbi:hypothetical protein KUCAC02_018998, partial [Chaenocephalus aceratus]
LAYVIILERDDHEEATDSYCAPNGIYIPCLRKRPPETKQRVAQRRLGLGCMLYFLHWGQMVGFPVAGICSSSSQKVRDRTNSSMSKGLFKSNDRYSPPPSSCACSQAPSDTSAIRVDCIKKDHFKETRCAPVSLRNETPIT